VSKVDHLVVIRMEDAPVDYHMVRSVEWARETYGSEHELALFIAGMSQHPRCGYFMVLMMPTGADLGALLDEYRREILNTLPYDTVATVLPFEAADANELLDWIGDNQLHHFSLATPTEG